VDTSEPIDFRIRRSIVNPQEGEYFERRVGAAAQEDAGRGKECEYE
jgi:hypothetical protein